MTSKHGEARIVTNARLPVVGHGISGPTATLDFKITKVVTHLLTAAIFELTEVGQGTWGETHARHGLHSLLKGVKQQ